MLTPFTTLTSPIIPIPRKDIDTDIIIPADFLKVTTKQGLGKNVFDRVREEKATEFLEFDKRISFAQILVARDNFGCGSSREHAVWALDDAGIRAVIAPSFANIFYNNALNNGLLPVPVPEDVVEELLRESLSNETFTITIDLASQEIRWENKRCSFEIDPYKRTCLLNGMSDLQYLLSKKTVIHDFDTKRKEFLFFDTGKV